MMTVKDLQVCRGLAMTSGTEITSCTKERWISDEFASGDDIGCDDRRVHTALALERPK